MLGGASAQTNPTAKKSVHDFKLAMDRWVHNYVPTRASIEVMHEGRLVLAEAYGGQSAGDRVPVWSLTKPITGVCVATLVQDNRIGFDDAIGPLLEPVFAGFGQPADPRLKQITIAQLLA